MKYIKIIGAFLLLAVLSIACEKDNITPADSTTTDPLVGSWKVGSFVKDGVDFTNQFTNYKFTCASNGAMTIQGNGSSYNCNWDWNDGNQSMYYFRIMGCGNNSILWECEGDWELTNHDSTHCYFSNHNPNHHSTMTWIKI